MRYFLCLPRSKAFLAGGIGATTRETMLVTFTCAQHLFSASGLRADVSAIDIAAIATTANHHLAMATNTVVQTGTSDARLLRREEQRGNAIMLDLC